MAAHHITSDYGSDLPNLMVTKDYLTKLLANKAVKSSSAATSRRS